jgi:hypothetical protein
VVPWMAQIAIRGTVLGTFSGRICSSATGAFSYNLGNLTHTELRYRVAVPRLEQLVRGNLSLQSSLQCFLLKADRSNGQACLSFGYPTPIAFAVELPR